MLLSPIPRPEYPRPDRQRGLVEGIDWLNLNGAWQFRFDPQCRGVEEQWFATGGPEWREQIIVPFCWESLAAWGEAHAAGNENYYSTRAFVDPVSVTSANYRSAPRYEVGWYRRAIEIPESGAWLGKRVFLTIGAADFFTEVWCNGISVGKHEGGYVPIELDLTDALAASGTRRALLVVRVEDPMDNREQPVGKQWGWYTPTSGIWQTVFLEPRGRAHIDYFRIIPDIDGRTATFEVFCVGCGEQATVVVEISPPEAPRFEVSLPVSGGVARQEVKIEPVSLWDTAAPRLYRVVFRLRQNEREEDLVRSYFGMRKIHTAPAAAAEKSPARLCLNNQPIYLRGALYQSYHPEGVYTARDAATLRNDISFARDAGFDFLRVHIKLDDPLVLYYADTLGMLLMQDFPNFGEGGDTPLGRQRFEQMMRLGFKRDFNHPAIIAWCLFNETWGFGGQTELMRFIAPTLSPKEKRDAARKMANTSSFRWVHDMWLVAKSIDSTRLIEDMSVVVWEHLAAYGHIDTDINSWHFYIDDYDRAKSHIENVVANTYRGSSFNYIEGSQQKDAPLINSEYGGVGALDGDRDISWTFKFLTNELRRHGQLSAYIFTQLTDVEWEYNGLLNYDRTPKQLGYPATLVNQGDVLPINAAPITQVTPGASLEVEVYSSHFSRRPRHGVTLHWHYTGMDDLGLTHAEIARGWVEIPFTQDRVELAKRVAIQAPSQPMLCTLWVSATCNEGNPVATNFVQHFVSAGEPLTREERGTRLILRQRPHEWYTAAWSGGNCTRDEARAARNCYGRGTGFFEWRFEDDAITRLGEARRVRILCEVSSRRNDTPQTDPHVFASNIELLINGLPVHRGILPDHPHDSRGSLSYLHTGGRGAYGYMISVTLEDELLRRVIGAAKEPNQLRMQCVVPRGSPARGGLTVYDYDSGRFPICPTVVIEA
ncbi:MAG: glycoside hydrolase family 2 TIM barrel-domain containing protein [Nibricoccus sp.]